MKTISGDFDLADMDITMSWVLSPSSAKKMMAKVTRADFHSNQGAPRCVGFKPGEEGSSMVMDTSRGVELAGQIPSGIPC